MVNVHRISAVTLSITHMERVCKFYSKIPGFKLIGGGTIHDTFSTFQIGYHQPEVYLNFELDKHMNSTLSENTSKTEYGRLIFHTSDVDELFSFFQSDKLISETIILETQPKDAPWGEKYFHLRDPEGYQLSFAQPIT